MLYVCSSFPKLSPEHRHGPWGQQSCWGGYTGRWCWWVWYPQPSSLWWPNDHIHSGHAPRRRRMPSALAQGSLTVGIRYRCELWFSQMLPQSWLVKVYLGRWCSIGEAPWTPRLCPVLRLFLYPQPNPTRTHMFEDKGDWCVEVLGVNVAHKGRGDIWKQDGGDFLLQALVCLIENCMILSVQNQGGLSQQSAHPWGGNKAHHTTACRTSLRLTSWSAQQAPFLLR